MMKININENITHSFVPIDLSGSFPFLFIMRFQGFSPRLLALMLEYLILFLSSESSWLFKGLLNVQESD